MRYITILVKLHFIIRNIILFICPKVYAVIKKKQLIKKPRDVGLFYFAILLRLLFPLSSLKLLYPNYER